MIRKKKIFQDESIKALALRIVPPLSAFRIRRKKKIHRITLYRISNDNGSTRNGSRFSREKKNPWNIPCSLRGGCPEWTLKRRRTGGHSYLNFQRRCYGSFAISPAEIPSSPLLLLLPSTTLFAPTDSRLDQTFENRPPSPPPPCNPAEIVVKFHLFRRWFRVELIKGGKKERKKEILFDSRTIVYVQKVGERERETEFCSSPSPTKRAQLLILAPIFSLFPISRFASS